MLGIQIRKIRMFLGLLDPDPDPLVRGMDPDPSLFSKDVEYGRVQWFWLFFDKMEPPRPLMVAKLNSTKHL